MRNLSHRNMPTTNFLRSRSRGRRGSRDRKKGSRRSRDKSTDKGASRGGDTAPFDSKVGGGAGGQGGGGDGAQDAKKKRKSRWGAQDDLEFIPGMPVTLPPNLTDEQQRLYLSESLN